MKLDYITEVKIFAGQSGKRVASGSFTVGDAIAVNFSVFEGKDGPRLVLPSTPNPKFDESKPADKTNKKFYDEVRPITLEARQELEAFLFDYIAKNAAGSSASDSGRNDPFPF